MSENSNKIDAIKGFYEVKKAIDEAREIVIVTHINADADALGSLVSMIRYCRELGKEVFGLMKDVPLLSLRAGEKILSKEDLYPAEVDLIIVVDSTNEEYTGLSAELSSWRLSGAKMLVIDHHASNEFFGDWNLIDPMSASTTLLIYNFFNFCSWRIDSDIATFLLAGIMGDTGNFSNAATSSNALRAAAELMEIGAKYFFIIKQMRFCDDPDYLRVWSRILSRLIENKKLNIVYSVILASDLRDDQWQILEGASNFFNYFGAAKLAMIIKETRGDELKISLRSDGSVDAASVAGWFGGGGHRRAAGFTVRGRLENEGGQWRVY